MPAFAGSQQKVRVEGYVRQLPFRVSTFSFHVRRVIGAIITFFGLAWDGPVAKYRPEDHYMRGPGPKWREKHSL